MTYYHFLKVKTCTVCERTHALIPATWQLPDPQNKSGNHIWYNCLCGTTLIQPKTLARKFEGE